MKLPPIHPRHALLVAALAVTGCGRQANATPIVQADSVSQLAPGAQANAPNAPNAPASAAPPLGTIALPPLPVPATFDVAALADQVKPWVVNITTTQKVSGPGSGEEEGGANPFDFFFGQRGGPHAGPSPREMKRQALGTGVIVDPSGYVVTNNHVIEGADDVRVRLADEREYKATVVGHDPKLDVALLKVEGVATLPAAPLGSSELLRVGESVLAVGNPFGLGHTVTLGIVSAKARSIGAGPYDDFIQTDASINPGNSGGPLFNWRGEVVGINTAIRAGANGIGFAIPIDDIKGVLGQLRDKGHVDRGRLGLAFQPTTPDLAVALGLDGPRGALVSEVEPNGPAAKAGIRAGDVVLSVNGTAITHAEELPRRVARNAPGTTIKVAFLHDKQQHEVSATLDALPDDEADAPSRAPGAIGKAAPDGNRVGAIRVADAPGGGVRVEGIGDDGIHDLRPGDLIVEVNGKPTRNVQELKALTAAAKPGSMAVFKVKRGRLTQFAAVPIPAK